jgi:hypothetical protein
VTGGVAPYLDLPATAMDTYGRSGRGYGEGRYRGERMIYAEVEYRASLMRNGLVGMVAFLDVTTVTNLETGERLFDTVAPGGEAGLRLLINMQTWNVGLSASTKIVLGSFGVRSESGVSDDNTLRRLQNGEAFHTKIQVRNVGLVYSFAFRF